MMRVFTAQYEKCAVGMTHDVLRYPLQADNPQRDAIFPVGFLVPAPAAGLGLSMLPEAALPSSSAGKTPALCGRVAVWKRTPAGVLCYERLEVGTNCGTRAPRHNLLCMT